MSKPNSGLTSNANELEWIQMRKEFSADSGVETNKEKFIRKFKSNPLVPTGCLLTAAALTYGLYSFRKGERKMSQMMMRVRIAAQGFTVVALVIGVMTATTTIGNKDEKK
ncbi:CLUMA_CG017169, isoform A [Clunio marinus]|uniref:CLUMA_CG017169, isoform A n=1 Tax=Clunio marinus TaxID=568069 RepID=A0A1J1IVD2_9DIPT|nr:CLUMA_CG017169, isoform A [Clunio marinus]